MARFSTYGPSFGCSLVGEKQCQHQQRVVSRGRRKRKRRRPGNERRREYKWEGGRGRDEGEGEGEHTPKSVEERVNTTVRFCETQRKETPGKG